MLKHIWLMVIFGVLGFSLAQAAETITLNSVGIKGPSGQTVVVGNTVTVALRYTPAEFDVENAIIEGTTVAANTGNLNVVRVQWYNGSGTYLGYNDVSSTQINRTQFTNGTTYTDYVTFVLPSPIAGAVSLICRSRVYADDGAGLKIYSGILSSSANIPDYFASLILNTNSAPYATNVQISNPSFAKVGQTLHGSYTYNDANGDLESGTSFRWLISSTVNGSYTAISGATSASYTLVSGDADNYLKFEVTPRAATGTSPGALVLSAASNQVTEAAIITITPYPNTLLESVANDGSLGSAFVRVLLTNATFITGSISGVTVSGLPAGLAVGAITRINSNEIHVAFSGRAIEHELAASILDPNDLYVHVPANQLVGVENQLTTVNGFYIQFANNGIQNYRLSAVGHNWITLSWNAPAGLKSIGSQIDKYLIWRNNIYYDIVFHTQGVSDYSYTDLSAVTGIPNSYKIQACYNCEGADPMSAIKSATALAVTAFSIKVPSVIGTIDHDAKSIRVIAAPGTDLTALIAIYTAPGAKVTIGGVTQSSGVTANNFSNPIAYTLTATDLSTCIYNVTVLTVLPPPVPEAGSELNQTTSSFTAKWGAVPGATGYRMDVSASSDFSSFLAAYQNLAVGNVVQAVVNNVAANSSYYYRVRATGAGEEVTSESSAPKMVTTLLTGTGTGSTTLDDSEAATTNVGAYNSPHGTVIPKVIINPDAFSPSANDLVEVFVSYGTAPVGLMWHISFDNISIANGIYTLYFTGLDYIPTQVGFTWDGGPLVLDDAAVITDTTITLNIGSLAKNGNKGIHNLRIRANDETQQTLPIVLSSFWLTSLTLGNVRIDWITQTESNLQGYYVLRHTEDDLANALVISPLIEATNTSTSSEYSYEDSEVPGNGNYFYWLHCLDMQGESTYFGPVNVLVSNAPDDPDTPEPVVTKLNAPFPNPFNPVAVIPFVLAKPDRVSIRIFNSRGQLVRKVIDTDLDATIHYITWDGRDDGGKPVASGTYFVRMNCKDYKSTRKLTMAK